MQYHQFICLRNGFTPPIQQAQQTETVFATRNSDTDAIIAAAEARAAAEEEGLPDFEEEILRRLRFRPGQRLPEGKALATAIAATVAGGKY